MYIIETLEIKIEEFLLNPQYGGAIFSSLLLFGCCGVRGTIGYLGVLRGMLEIYDLLFVFMFLIRLWFRRSFVIILLVWFCIVGVPFSSRIPPSFLWTWLLYARVFFHFFSMKVVVLIKKEIYLLLFYCKHPCHIALYYLFTFYYLDYPIYVLDGKTLETFWHRAPWHLQMSWIITLKTWTRRTLKYTLLLFRSIHNSDRRPLTALVPNKHAFELNKGPHRICSMLSLRTTPVDSPCFFNRKQTFHWCEKSSKRM